MRFGRGAVIALALVCGVPGGCESGLQPSITVGPAPPGEASSGCYYPVVDPEFRVRVVDRDSGDPLCNATVHAFYLDLGSETLLTPFGSPGECGLAAHSGSFGSLYGLVVLVPGYVGAAFEYQVEIAPSPSCAVYNQITVRLLRIPLDTSEARSGG